MHVLTILAKFTTVTSALATVVVFEVEADAVVLAWVRRGARINGCARRPNMDATSLPFAIVPERPTSFALVAFVVDTGTVASEATVSVHADASMKTRRTRRLRTEVCNGTRC